MVQLLPCNKPSQNLVIKTTQPSFSCHPVDQNLGSAQRGSWAFSCPQGLSMGPLIHHTSTRLSGQCGIN